MAEMFALKTIELVAKYLPRAVADGSDKEAREMMAYANTFAGYYMMCTSAHTVEHTMGSFHDKLVHGAGLIMIAHAYYDFFAERKASEENMVKMAKAMGAPDAKTGKDFIKALDKLIADVGCADLKMSEAGITKDELKLYPKKVHEVLGGLEPQAALEYMKEHYGAQDGRGEILPRAAADAGHGRVRWRAECAHPEAFRQSRRRHDAAAGLCLRQRAQYLRRQIISCELQRHDSARRNDLQQRHHRGWCRRDKRRAIEHARRRRVGKKDQRPCR